MSAGSYVRTNKQNVARQQAGTENSLDPMRALVMLCIIGKHNVRLLLETSTHMHIVLVVTNLYLFIHLSGV